MTLGVMRWRIELLASTYPDVEWVELRHWTGKRYRYIDREEAEIAIEKLLAIQPHIKVRVSSL